MVAAYTAADKFDAIIAIDAPTARSESLSPSHKIVFSDLAESGQGVKRGQFWREIRLRRRTIQSYVEFTPFSLEGSRFYYAVNSTFLGCSVRVK